MAQEKPLLEDLLNREDIREAAASSISSAIADWPNVASSMVNSSMVAVFAASGTATSFASAVASKLGFASGVGQADILGALTSRVASALRGMPEFASHLEVASALAALVASAMSNRIMTSSEAATMLSSRVASATGKRLSPRKSVDD